MELLIGSIFLSPSKKWCSNYSNVKKLVDTLNIADCFGKLDVRLLREEYEMRYEKIMYSQDETEQFALKLANLLQAQDMITLEGDLGAGKTTFTKALAQGLGITRTVNSPTFTIMKQYEGRLPFNHLDVYRLAESVEDLGWDELFYGDAVSVIEWAHLIEPDLPQERLAIEIYRIGEQERRFVLIPHGKRYEALCEELMK